MTERPTLYLMVGYPGSGKSTTAQVIQDLTGAVHLWADHERGKMFTRPTHSKEESQQLYDLLNQRTAQLLSEGKSVIFDTSFNHLKDREHLKQIAISHDADTKLLWVSTDENIAKQRATHVTHQYRNGYTTTMPVAEWERTANNLESPSAAEQPIILDGTKITHKYVAEKLGLAR